MKINLRKRKLKDGRESLYLDYYKDGKRNIDFLKLYIKRGDPNNKEILSLAEKIKSERLIRIANDEYDQISSNKKRASFTKYFEKFIKTKPKWSNYEGALKYLKLFQPGDVLFKQINKTWLNNFAEYLSKDAGLKKNTSFLYFRKIKEVLYKASYQGFIKAEIIRQAKNLQREKIKRGFLELDEIEKLIKTPADRTEIKIAFLFSCFTGLRQCDIRNLKWKDISDNTIKIEQQKTKDPVLVPLSQTALNILRTGNIFHLPENNIFDLPTDRTTINRALTRWFKAAKVEKKAFYHLSRHTFPVLHLDRGTDIYTVSKLLGHKSLKTTEIYADISSKKLKKSVDNLPILEVK